MAVERGFAGVAFPRPERRAVLLGIAPAQLGVFGVALVVAVVVVSAVPSGAGLLAAVLTLTAAGAGATVPVAGRRLDEWAGPVGGWFRAWVGGRLWRSPVAALGARPGTGPRPVPPPPLRRVVLVAARRRGGSVGVVKDAGTGTYTAALACRGRAFALLDPSEQERLAALWGDALAAFACEGSPVVRLGWVERTVPEEGDALQAHLMAAGDRGAPEPALRSYEALVAAAGPVTQRHETFLTLGIDAARAKKAIRQAGGGDVGACRVLLDQIATLAERCQRAEVEVVEVLGPRRLAAVIRAAYDPGAVSRLALRARIDPGRDGCHEASAWPLVTDVTWDHYRTDSGFHATYSVAEWPRRQVGADFLHPLLLRPSSTHTVALVMEPVPPSRATRGAESAQATFLADEELRAKAGYLPTARRRKEHEAILARDRELADGHAEFRFAGYVTVTASTREALEEAAGEIERLGYDAQVELRRLYGTQDVAFTYTLPMGRGLS